MSRRRLPEAIDLRSPDGDTRHECASDERETVHRCRFCKGGRRR